MSWQDWQNFQNWQNAQQQGQKAANNINLSNGVQKLEESDSFMFRSLGLTLKTLMKKPVQVPVGRDFAEPEQCIVCSSADSRHGRFQHAFRWNGKCLFGCIPSERNQLEADFLWILFWKVIPANRWRYALENALAVPLGIVRIDSDCWMGDCTDYAGD